MVMKLFSIKTNTIYKEELNMTMEEFAQELDRMDATELMLGAGLIGIILVLMLIGSIAWFIISAIGYRKMFLKAGEAGWKAFIPYYNNFICFKLAWNTKVFLPFLGALLLIQCIPASGSLLLQLVVAACGIIFIVLGIKLDIRVAKSFGKTAGWGVLLFFFPFIVSLILGYGKAEYIGNTTV